jgi:hypothetical protein
VSRNGLRGLPDRESGVPPVNVNAFEDLMILKLPPVSWVVPGILPEGVTLLAGKAKVRKSWMALGLCIAVAAGGVALGTKRVERGESLYCALEDNARRLQSRGRKVLGADEPPSGFFYAIDWPRVDEGGAEALDAWLSEHPTCRLVVLDTLAKVRPRPRGAHGGYMEDYEALESLLPIAAEHHVSILVVTHTRKASASDVLDEINATTGLMGGVDGFLVFRTERGKAEATLHVDGRDIEEPGELALRWDRELHGWTLVGDAETSRLTEERREVLDALRGAGGPMGTGDVARAIGKSQQAAGNLLARLLLDERVDKVGRGLWRISELHTFTPPTGEGCVKGEGQDPADSAAFGQLYTITHPTHPNDVYGVNDDTGVDGVNVYNAENPYEQRENFTHPPCVKEGGGGVNGVEEDNPGGLDDPFGDDSRVW